LSQEKENKDLRIYSPKLALLSKSLQLISVDSPTEAWSPSDIQGKEVAISMIQYAQTFVGTPYVWGGQSALGFDCSGFTSFVFLNQGKKIPRVSRDQYASSLKLDPAEACIGDLVFFGQQGVVSHVGILVNELGKPKRMIHSSSSKGVMFQDIDNSKYYSSRVIGYGRY
jgi:cell wall-associated NlpC family hydrolase